jgi:hypothetical protein
MYEEHPIFESPDPEDQSIWRYMDFTKLLAIFENQSLFFTRSDKFRDSYEGSYPIYNKVNRPLVYSHIPQDDLKAVLKEQERSNASMRKFVFINCWHLNDFESAAMWELYLKTDEGISIKSNFKRLKESIIDTESKVHIGKVNYVDYEDYWMPEGNALFPYLHKRKSFEHEKELRAIILKLPMIEDIDFGINIKIDIETLIEGIYIAPTAPKWFAELVESVVKRYGFNFQVTQSNLYNDPVF